MQTYWTYFGTFVVLFIPSVKLQVFDTGINLYSARYDNLNIDTILNSNRLVTNYVDCLTNKKPCPPEGKDLKRILPEALRTKCSRCSPRQKENALKVIRKLYDDYPQHYNALREKWDSTGEYHRRFLEYLADEQFNQVGSNDFNRDQSQINSQTFRPSPSIASTRRPTTVRPLTTRATRSPAIDLAGNSGQEVVPQASFNSPSTSVLPIFNRFGEVTTTVTTATTISAPSISNINSSPTISVDSTTTASTDSNSSQPETEGELQVYQISSTESTTTSTEMRQPNPSTISQTVGVSVGNRFGEDFDAAPPTTSRTPQRNRPPITTTTTTTTTDWTQFFPNLFQPPQPNGPIAQVINHFGNKISRTSEVIAGMIQNTARFIGAVVQPQTPPNYVN